MSAGKRLSARSEPEASGVRTRWLVTGAAGQLGRSLLEAAPELGIDAVGRARSELDVGDPDAVARTLDELRPEVVLNAAAFTAVDRCETERQAAERANAWAPGVLARACRGAAVLVHLSTDYVFPGTAHRPVAEDDAVEPLSAYGRSKWQGEQAVRDSGCDHLIARVQWLFGPGANFVRTIQKAAQQGSDLRVVEDQLGRPTATRALAPRLVQAVERGVRGTLHLGCEGIASWFDFAREIVAEGAARGQNPKVNVLPVASEAFPRPARRPLYGVLDLTRARAAGLVLPHWRDALRAHLDSRDSERGADNG
jgi:dTDP-4-dehydrorhamnose reductase